MGLKAKAYAWTCFYKIVSEIFVVPLIFHPRETSLAWSATVTLNFVENIYDTLYWEISYIFIKSVLQS